jgi:Zn-dependent M28 family amino/carboxypeptidase
MNKSILYLLSFISILEISGCHLNSGQNWDSKAAFTRDSLVKHIIILASDSFQGRKPCTPGETKTLDYIKSSFATFGLESGNGSSYLQDVPLMNITCDPDSLMKVTSVKGSFDLHNITDYVVYTSSTDSVVSLDNDELIFAGYGVVAPEYHWNDYAGLDVKGKVVLVMLNDRGIGASENSLFKGMTVPYYGRRPYKFEEAARQGAKACLIIHNTAAASIPFSTVQNGSSLLRHYVDNTSSGQYHCSLNGWVSADAAKKLLTAAGKDTSLFIKANTPGFKAISLGERLSFRMRVKSVHNISHNVIGKITGSKRPDEYIIYTAHWDHLGIGKPDSKGDSIYNGALDNASGTAALLEIARAFTLEKEKPERTILFLSVTAEEEGLLGSAYYASHPIYPLNKTVADINIDGINPYGRTKDIVIIGAGQNDLEDYVTEEGEKQGRYISPDPLPEKGYYFLSDQFSFAKVGVPALFAWDGEDYEGEGKEYGKSVDDDSIKHHYHQPSDEYNPT